MDKKRKLIIAGIGLFILALAVYSFIIDPVRTPEVIKPPVVEVNKMEVLNASPAGKLGDMNSLFSVSVKFSENLEPSGNGILVEIVPYVPYKKYVLNTYPDTLWIQPSTEIQADHYGWVDDIQYTVLIKKGSIGGSGSMLQDNYTFTFKNSVGEINLPP